MKFAKFMHQNQIELTKMGKWMIFHKQFVISLKTKKNLKVLKVL